MLGLHDIFGQPQAIDAITRAYLGDRLPHGMIFAGPDGVGKATTARALAGLFLCDAPHQAAACGQCQACHLSATGNHPDYHVITKEMIRLHDKTGKSKGIALSIDVMRPELIEPANRKTTMGRGKVFVVEQADLMTTQAQNAILKTLEEPAGRTLVVLLTSQPLSLLPTIRSRCQMMVFAPLEREVVKAQLEKRGIAAADAADAAGLSAGSLGLALRWIEDGVVDNARQLRQRLQQVMDGNLVADLPEWFKAAADDYAQKQLDRDELASKDQANREALELYLSLSARLFSRRLSDPAWQPRLEPLCAAIDAVVQAQSHLDANVTISLIFQQFVVNLESLFAAA